MRRLSWLGFITLVAIACSGASALARVTASDANSTRAYLEARIVLRRASVAAEPAVLKAIDRLAAKVRTECPGVLRGAPPRVKGEKANQSELATSQELLTVTLGGGEEIEHPADVRFEKTVRRLRWSSRKLTRLLRSLALEQAEQSAIPRPNLCSDMKAWVASGYTTVSAGTRTFLHHVDVVSSITQIEDEPREPATNFLHLDALIAYRLKPYENRADQILARKALPPEREPLSPAALKAAKPFFDAVGAVYTALGRSALS